MDNVQQIVNKLDSEYRGPEFTIGRICQLNNVPREVCREAMTKYFNKRMNGNGKPKKRKRMAKKKKWKKLEECPHCGSNKGVKATFSVSGYGWENRDFNGNRKKREVVTSDTADKAVECLNCNRVIPAELIRAYPDPKKNKGGREKGYTKK